MTKVWDKPITADTDWGGDASTGGLPVSGRMIQAFIKESLALASSKEDIEQFVKDYLEEIGMASDEVFVTLATEQTIKAIKDFEAGFKVGGSPLITFDKDLNAFILRANLVTEGGVISRALLDEIKVPTFMDGVVTDEVTISKADGVLRVLKAGLDKKELINILEEEKYVTQSWVTSYNAEELKKYVLKTDLPSDIVTESSDQKVSGIKDFVNGIRVDGLSIYKSIDDTIYIDANVVVRGGITSRGTNKTTTPTLFEALPIDERTIKRNAEGVLYVDEAALNISTGGGGGVADSVAWSNITDKPEWIGASKPSYTYSEIGDTPNLSEYILKSEMPLRYDAETQSFILDGNLILSGGLATRAALGALDVPTIMDALVVDGSNLKVVNGVLTFIGQTGGGGASVTYESVVNALGFTPYSATNPNGYITSSGSITGNAGSATALKTNTGYMYAQAFNVDKIVDIGADATFQGYSTYIDGMYIRFRYGSANTTAMEIGTDGNVVIGGTTANEKLHVHGNVKATKFIGDLQGAADSATKLATSRTIWGQSFDGTGNILYTAVPKMRYTAFSTDGNNIIGYVGHASSYKRIFLDAAAEYELSLNANGASAGAGIYITKDNNVVIGGTTADEKLHVHGNVKAAKFIGNLTGTADYAMKLSCLPTGQPIDLNNLSYPLIWFYGQSVTKTNFPSGFLYGGVLNLITSGGSLNGQLAWDITHNSTTAPTKKLYWRASNNNGFRNDWHEIVFRDDSTLSPSSGTLTINGNLLATGGITGRYTSDRRLKENIRKFSASKILMSLGGVFQFEYADSEVAKNNIYVGSHIGLIYQNVQGTALDRMCHENENGYGSLNYLEPSFISLVAGATMENVNEIAKLKKENRALRKRIEQLEKSA